ncbi:MAG: lipocalin-like domain-containing protein [Acidobacteria bacterium]|nr:lipocalin-like domain-containing protein [Acidobacteriota bacterium]
MMRKTWMPCFVLFASVAVIAAFGCSGEAPPAEPEAEAAAPAETAIDTSANERFAGVWSLTRIERRDVNGELLGEPTTDRLGYLMYDASGHMGVTLMQPDRQLYAGDTPTADEALDRLGTYTSYFGPFTVNEADGYVTHHLLGSVNPSGAGSDYQRFFTFGDNTLTLQPPPNDRGEKSFITWTRLPDLPESELTDTHRRLVGVYSVESVERRTGDGEEVPANQYEVAYIMYAPSGHMSVHLMRPGRTPYAGDRPTPEEALMATDTYGSYFGPFSVNEEERYLVHHRIGSENPNADGSDAQRFYELTDTHLVLMPPPGTDDEGRPVQSRLTWRRISD